MHGFSDWDAYFLLIILISFINSPMQCVYSCVYEILFDLEAQGLYRAMLCVARTMLSHVRPSVCLSITSRYSTFNKLRLWKRGSLCDKYLTLRLLIITNDRIRSEEASVAGRQRVIVTRCLVIGHREQSAHGSNETNNSNETNDEAQRGKRSCSGCSCCDVHCRQTSCKFRCFLLADAIDWCLDD